MKTYCQPSLVSSEVRRWPYPYRGAVSISNDIDFCGFEFFEEFMRYCNTTKKTRFGVGLGLEVTSSFFGFSPPGRQFSYFSGLAPNAPLSDLAPRIAEYILMGWIDANHAYGDFDGVGGFHRAHAERLHQELSRLGRDLRIFINHGDELNSQCIGPGAEHHRGDVIGASEYHTDLMQSERPNYVTTSVHSIGHVDESMPIFGKKQSAWSRLLSRKTGGFRDSGKKLIAPYSLQDGRDVLSFMRLRGTGFNAPNLSSLTYQSSMIDFNELYEHEGGVVLYQHWGVLHRAARKCVSATVQDVVSRPELLSGLRRLKKEADAGDLWVSGLERLLDYVTMVENTSVSKDNQSGSIEIFCKLPVKQPHDFFQGLTVYIDPASDIRINFNHEELPFQYNGPDHTGKYSVSVKSIAKEDIW